MIEIHLEGIPKGTASTGNTSGFSIDDECKYKIATEPINTFDDKTDSQPPNSLADDKTLDSNKINELVRKFRDPSCRVREIAQRELEEQLYGTGLPGINALRCVLATETSPEVYSRLQDVIKRLMSHPDLWRTFQEERICEQVEYVIEKLPESDQKTYREFVQALLKGDAARVIELFSWHPEELTDNSLTFKRVAQIILQELGVMLTFAIPSSLALDSQDPTILYGLSKELRIGFLNQPARICIEPEEICKPAIISYEHLGKRLDHVDASYAFSKLIDARFSSLKVRNSSGEDRPLPGRQQRRKLIDENGRNLFRLDEGRPRALRGDDISMSS